MPFDEHGFLGKQIIDIANQNYEENKKVFDNCYDLNKLAYAIKLQLSIHIEDGQEVVSSCLFVKILNGFQAATILYKYGLESEAKIITRTILEAVFILKAIADNPEEVVAFVNTDKKKRETLLKLIHEKDKNNVMQSLKASLNKEMYEELKKENKKEKVKSIEVFEWAEKAGLETYHKYAYTCLNADVHTDIRNLEKHLILDESRNILGISCIPSTREIDGTLFTACCALLIALDSLVNIFSLDYEKEINDLHGRIVKLVHNCA